MICRKVSFILIGVLTCVMDLRPIKGGGHFQCCRILKSHADRGRDREHSINNGHHNAWARACTLLVHEYIY